MPHCWKSHVAAHIRESDVPPGQTEVKQGKFVEIIFRAKGYFRETYKSQYIYIPLLQPLRGVCKVIVFASMLIHTFPPKFDMQHDHIQIFLTF